MNFFKNIIMKNKRPIIINGGGGGGPLWTPSSASNTIKQWVRPEELGTGTITTWNAHVGVNLASVSGTDPVIITSAHNGRPIVRFTGVEELTAAFGSHQNFPYTAGYIFKYTGDTSTLGVLFDGYTLDSVVVRTLSSQFNCYSDNGTPTVFGTTDNNWHVLLITINGSSSTIQIDGSAETSAPLLGNSYMDGLTIGSHIGGVYDSSVDVQEVVVWDGVLGSIDKSSWFTYGVTSR